MVHRCSPLLQLVFADDGGSQPGAVPRPVPGSRNLEAQDQDWSDLHRRFDRVLGDIQHSKVSLDFCFVITN